MKESTTINIKVLARRVPPDYTSESLIIYNHVTNEKAFIGEEIRKEKVTPSGRPTLVKPINRGMEEQEQKGVTVPRSAEIIFAPIP